MKLLAKLLLLIFGLSVAGYVLLDTGHELLHSVKTNLHKHEIDKHHHDHPDSYREHHHVEDHQKILAPEDRPSREKSSVQISYFFFYFQQPIEYIVATAVGEDFKRCLFNKVINPSFPPRTPPPLVVHIS